MTTLKTLKKFNIPSLCKTVFFLDLIFVLVFMIPFSLITLLVPRPANAQMPPLGIIGIVMTILHPILMTVFSAVAGGLYNLISAKTGGIKVEVE